MVTGTSTDPWFICLEEGRYHLMVDYSPELGLFGLSTSLSLGDGCDEIHLTREEVLARVLALAPRGLGCALGTVSFSAYCWAKQALEHATGYVKDEYRAIVDTYEKARFR